jgi:HK97 family phage prohead protease
MDRKIRAELAKGQREVRRVTSTGMELRALDGGGLSIAGLASRTATPYDMGFYDETISRGAFAETLKRTPDVQLLVNHDGLPLARTTIPTGQLGALTLREDQDGLKFDAVLDDSDPDVQRLASKVRAGLMDQCSFAFRVIRQDWRWTEDTGAERDAREIQEVSLDRGDVSVCNYGANPNTGVSMRSTLIDMSDEEFASLGDEVLARFRRLTDPVEQSAAAPVFDLDYFRARAYALGQHK